MGSRYISPYGEAKLVVPTSAKLAAFSATEFTIDKIVAVPNFPDSEQNLFTGTGAHTTAAFTAEAEVIVRAGPLPVLVNIGASAAVFERQNYQGAPGVLDTTGILTAALILSGIVTSSTASAVTGTLDTGAIMDAAVSMDVGDSFDWSVINTGNSNDFTVAAAASGHTLVGDGVVQESSSARFRTRKTAAATFVTYRLSV